MDRKPPEPQKPTPTAHLVRAAQEGDEARFTELYSRVAPAVFAWARLRIGPAVGRLDPEDVVQEVWCRAVLRFREFDPERAPFRNWVFGVANVVLLESFRRLRAAASDPGETSRFLDKVPDTATSISRRVARDEVYRSMVERLAQLEEDDRALVIYCGLEGLSYEEAAPLLRISAHAIAKRWQRLRARLRETLRQNRWSEILACAE